MAYMQTPFLPNDSCVAFVLADVTAFVRRLLSLLYIPLVTVTCSAPIWAYSVLPISVTSVPWPLLFFCLPLSFLVLRGICLWVSFSTSSSLFCLGSFEPLDFSVVFCLPFPGCQALDGVTSGHPSGPWRRPLETLSPVLTGAAQVCCSRAWHGGPIYGPAFRWPWGWASPSLGGCVEVCKRRGLERLQLV